MSTHQADRDLHMARWNDTVANATLGRHNPPDRRSAPTLPPPPAAEISGNLRAMADELDRQADRMKSRAQEYRLAALRSDIRARSKTLPTSGHVDPFDPTDPYAGAIGE